jgi:hypothetical protein
VGTARVKNRNTKREWRSREGCSCNRSMMGVMGVVEGCTSELLFGKLISADLRQWLCSLFGRGVQFGKQVILTR